MPILPTESNYDDSPFYKIMEDRGRIWSEVAEEVGADINGFYNAYSLEFELSKKIGNNLLKMNGRRRLEYVNSKRIIAKNLILYFFCPTIDREKHLKIGKKVIINFFYNRFGHYNHRLSTGEFKVRFNSELFIDRIFGSNILYINEINRIVVNDKGIQIRVQDLPKKIDEVRLLVDFWKVLI
jgi:hypothetical protein